MSSVCVYGVNIPKPCICTGIYTTFCLQYCLNNPVLELHVANYCRAIRGDFGSMGKKWVGCMHIFTSSYMWFLLGSGASIHQYQDWTPKNSTRNKELILIRWKKGPGIPPRPEDLGAARLPCSHGLQRTLSARLCYGVRSQSSEVRDQHTLPPTGAPQG